MNVSNATNEFQAGQSSMIPSLLILGCIILALLFWLVFGNKIKDVFGFTIRKGKYQSMKEKYDSISPTLDRLKQEIEKTNQKNKDLSNTFESQEQEIAKLKEELEESEIKLTNEARAKENALDLTKQVQGIDSRLSNIDKHLESIKSYFKSLPKEDANEFDDEGY